MRTWEISCSKCGALVASLKFDSDESEDLVEKINAAVVCDECGGDEEDED